MWITHCVYQATHDSSGAYSMSMSCMTKKIYIYLLIYFSLSSRFWTWWKSGNHAPWWKTGFQWLKQNLSDGPRHLRFDSDKTGFAFHKKSVYPAKKNYARKFKFENQINIAELSSIPHFIFVETKQSRPNLRVGSKQLQSTLKN